MDRATWLAERRAAVVASYDADAPTYDQLDYPTAVQEAWVSRVLQLCPRHSLVLDAPCGTGKYFAQVVAAGHRVAGIDQSAGMLAEARARGLAVSLEQRALTDLASVHAFDAVLTIDAIENVPPEDWPRVLANLQRAVRPGGLLYLTVEEVDDAMVERSFALLSEQGMPAVRGEVVDGNVAGYHYYPDRERVVGWFGAAGLTILDEGYQQEVGWGYRHFLLRARG